MPPPPIYHFLLHLYIPFFEFIQVPNAQFLSYIVSEEGEFVSSALAEQFEYMMESEVEMEVVDKKLGHGKRCKDLLDAS